MATPFALDLCIFMLKLSFHAASFHVYSPDSSSANNIVYTLKQILVSRRENTWKNTRNLSLSLGFWNVHYLKSNSKSRRDFSLIITARD